MCAPEHAARSCQTVSQIGTCMLQSSHGHYCCLSLFAAVALFLREISSNGSGSRGKQSAPSKSGLTIGDLRLRVGRIGGAHMPNAHKVLSGRFGMRNPDQAQRAVSCMEMDMKKMLLAAAALAVLTTSPAFAKSHACRFLGHSRGAAMNGPGYNAYDDYYAWTPGCYHGHPSPYAQYDQNGHIYDENLPDLW
jgi:hypothetical protein